MQSVAGLHAKFSLYINYSVFMKRSTEGIGTKTNSPGFLDCVRQTNCVAKTTPKRVNYYNSIMLEKSTVMAVAVTN